MPTYFPADKIKELRVGHEEVQKRFIELRQRFIARKYKNGRAHEFATHGFCRRLGTLVRALALVFEILPPEREDIPERDEVVDATIAIQSFVLNSFGCLDNLAWIWVCEKNVKGKNGKDLDPKQVGFASKFVRSSLTDRFRIYLDSRQAWYENLKDF
jgi:hypothetical protein